MRIKSREINHISIKLYKKIKRDNNIRFSRRLNFKIVSDFLWYGVCVGMYYILVFLTQHIEKKIYTINYI